MWKRFLWDEAKAVLARAEQEVEAFDLEDLRADVRRAQRELALAERLDEIRLDRVTMSDEVGRVAPMPRPGSGRSESRRRTSPSTTASPHTRRRRGGA